MEVIVKLNTFLDKDTREVMTPMQIKNRISLLVSQLDSKQQECDSLSENYGEMNIHLLGLEVKIMKAIKELK